MVIVMVILIVVVVVVVEVVFVVVMKYLKFINNFTISPVTLPAPLMIEISAIFVVTFSRA